MWYRILIFALLCVGCPVCAQDVPSKPTSEAGQPATPSASNLLEWKGLTVSKISFEGVTFGPGDTLPAELPQQSGKPLDPEAVKQSLRRLYATGRYRTIEVRGIRSGDSVALIFAGPVRYYVGLININGVKNERLASLLEYSTNLQPGTPWSTAELETATASLKTTLEQNGYYAPVIAAATRADNDAQQMNVTFTVNQGAQARVGEVTVAGNPGMSLIDFRKKGRLKQGSKLTRDTTTNALTHLRRQYQKEDRLEAKVTLQGQTYQQPKHTLDSKFNAEQGPVVRVFAEGAKISRGRLKRLVPVYEESAVDNDLLNEGSHNIREYMQKEGYFNAQVSVKLVKKSDAQEAVIYSVNEGGKYKVKAIAFKGNKYFQEDLLRERMQVQKADPFVRYGRYSQALLSADANNITALYRANGFSNVKITPDVKTVDKGEDGKALKVSQILVTMNVDEGPQQTFGTVALNGIDPARSHAVRALMNTVTGQPYSLITLSGDRDAVLAYYLAHGFDKARVEIQQKKADDNPEHMNVALNVSEGPQVFVDRILLSGVHYTRPQVVQSKLLLHPNDALDESALLETQRKLYDLALFSEVNTAVQNPDGDATRKNVVVQLREAKRWDMTYGFGFEAQTGTPVLNCAAQESLTHTNTCSQEGEKGVSPRVSLDVTRINFRGRDETLTLHTNYGLLEKVATLTFSNPHLLGNPKFDLSLSGGYTDVQNITTFAASTLQASTRVTQHLRKQDTLIYDYTFRYVKVDASSLQVTANLIPLLSQPVRVGGPGITWLHDTRQPSPLNATHGSYTSVREFFSHSAFGSEADYNRTDLTNSTYYAFGRNKRFVIARNTRFGFENAFHLGDNPILQSTSCQGIAATNPSCSPVPLPERLYAGGAASHRGFPSNGAGPRDLQTGYPVGGTGAFVNTTEFRFPGPTLPLVGNSIDLVLFHDMGNVFTKIGDIWPSFGRVTQPDSQTCSMLTDASGNPLTQGVCNFNYFSHAVGAGLRYKTPIGPIRLDFSYNLNPPVYPVIDDYNAYPLPPPYVGQAAHFNFFFSIGQSF